MYVQVAELPESLTRALAAVDYRKADINVEARERTSMLEPGGLGMREFVVLVDLATRRSETHMGSWGGANMFNPNNAVDLDTTDRAIIPGMAVIKGHEGGGTRATIYLHPENITKLLPAKSDVSEREGRILGYLAYKANYRRECLDQMGCKPEEIDSLVSRGFIARNKAGAISLTTAG